MIAFLAGMIGVVTAIIAGTLALFVCATVVAGASQGIAISAATRGLLHGVRQQDRAPTFSVIYLICYSAAACPSLISGELSDSFSLRPIALGYAGLAFVSTLITVIVARDPYAETRTPRRPRVRDDRHR